MDTIYDPARCKAKLPNNLDDPNLIAEPKLDGSRYVLYIGELGMENYHRFLSRRKSVKDGLYVNKAENVPHITGVPYPELHDTVLDGEILLAGHAFYTLNGIMNSLPEEANRKQRELGLLDYWAFDILQFMGTDVRHQPFYVRRNLLANAVHATFNKNVHLIEQFHTDFEARFMEEVEKGGEGLVIKELDKPYGKGWAKMKKSYDVSCIVMGFKPGTGKYEEQMGALRLGVYRDNTVQALAEGRPVLVEVGFASGMDDNLRQHITEHPNLYMYKVVDVYAQSLTEAIRLRHPTFYRFRDDVDPKTITSNKLREDFATNKTKGKRQR